MDLNETHDPAVRSWLPSANAPGCDFPLQNLPLGVFRRASETRWRVGAAIGDCVADLADPLFAPLLEPATARACQAPVLNDLMALGRASWHGLRVALSRALRSDSVSADRLAMALVPQTQARYALPASVGDFSDFYTSIHHATAVGRLLRPNQPLLPNYKWVPIAYHGRASSLCVSGTPIQRPCGQIRMPGSAEPVLAASERLDYEVELGVLMGEGNEPGEPVRLADAWERVFGVVLLNDWSARDIQAWEYQPLGPFLSKSFATTLSPWVVTAEALLPFRVPASTRPAGDPLPLPYLQHAQSPPPDDAVDITLEAHLLTPHGRARGEGPALLSRSSSRHAYWTIAQMVAHHTINGCNLRSGDLLGTGTQSGPDPGEAGSLMELTHGGLERFALPNGEQRGFLEDGDEILLRGYCERSGFVRIGLGTATGQVQKARTAS